MSLSPDGRFALPAAVLHLDRSCGGNPNCIPLTPPGGASRSRVSVLDTTTNTIVAATTVAIGQSPITSACRPTAPSSTPPTIRRPAAPVEPDHPCALGETRGHATGPRRRILRETALRAYVATNQSVVVVDAATHAVVATIPFGRRRWHSECRRDDAAAASDPAVESSRDGDRESRVADVGPSPSGGLAGYVLEGGVDPRSVLASIPTGSSAPAFTFDAPTGAFFVRMHAMAPGGAVQPRTRSRSSSTCRSRRRRPTGLLGLATAPTSPSAGRLRRRVGRRRRSSSMSAAR